MTELHSGLMRQALAKDIKLAIAPMRMLEDARADITKLAAENALNDYQKLIMQRYVFDVPDVGFTPKSVVIAAWRKRLYRAVFRHGGKEAACFVEGDENSRPPSVGGMQYVMDIFAAAGFKAEQPPGLLPLKLLAVGSGLCEYGRNNIAYCGDWGSFVRLGHCVSDIEPEDYAWRSAFNMAACEKCGNCIKNCSTGAILPHRFLIDNEVCLTRINNRDGAPLPGHVPPTIHHALYGCYRCQEICPANTAHFADVDEIIFDEAETAAMLNADSFLDCPEGIRKKLWHYDTGAKYECIPRNLRLLLENPDHTNFKLTL